MSPAVQAYLWLVGSVVLLLPPSGAFFRTGTLWWSYERILSESKLRRRAWRHPHHLWDLGRAAAGAWAARQAFALLAAEQRWPSVVEEALVALVVLAGLLAQLFLATKPDLILAPFASVVGVLLGWLPVPAVAVGVLLGAASVRAFRLLTPAFALGSLALVPMGLVLGTPLLRLGAAAGVAFLTALLLWTSDRATALRIYRHYIEESVRGRSYSRLRDVPHPPRRTE